MFGEVELFISPWVRLLCPLTEKKDKILSAHNQIDAGNLLRNVLTFCCIFLCYFCTKVVHFALADINFLPSW
jgi:hypothetical protein